MSTTATVTRRKLTREQLRQLTELERQQYYTDQLDDETYEYPLFSGKQAVLSQRRSGYRTSAKAAREIIDNSLEAGAKNVWIVFDRPVATSRGKHERQNAVSAIAFIDDGPGMTPKMARYSLTWGGGTHHEDPVKIGTVRLRTAEQLDQPDQAGGGLLAHRSRAAVGRAPCSTSPTSPNTGWCRCPLPARRSCPSLFSPTCPRRRSSSRPERSSYGSSRTG